MTVRRGTSVDPDEVAATVLRYRDWFLELEPRHGQEARFKTILIVFPDIPTADAPALIDSTQRLLKRPFVEAGLMIGQFHPMPPDEGGLWNADFRPLRSPVPLLAIRHMVATDLPFLTKERGFVESYLTHFQQGVPERYRRRLEEVMASFSGLNRVGEHVGE